MTIQTTDRNGADLDIAAKEIGPTKFPRNIITDPAGNDMTPASEATVQALLTAAQAIQAAAVALNAKTTAVNTGAIGGTVAVSNMVAQGLTDAQLRAQTLAVGGTVALDGPTLAALESIQATTGGLTDLQLRATPLALPTGAASEATLAGVSAKLPALNAGRIPVELPPGGGGLTNTELRAEPVATVAAAPLFWRVGFAEVGSGLQGKAAEELTLVQTGPGMAVNQASGNLVITTGTTVNSETVLRSVLRFRGSLAARYKVILSQRIVNQTFRFELADLIGTGLAYTINSTTSVTVNFPTTNPFTAASVGQSLRLSALSSVGIPGRYAIASVSGLSVTFTVSGFPASGAGTLTLYGFNWLANEYSGTSATNSSFDAQRRGWASGNTNITINTTAAPGHVAHLNFDVMTAGISDGLVASNGGYQWTTRGSRVENIPDEDVDLHFFIVVQNGTVAPASSTTMTVGFLQVEDQGRQKVRIASSDPGATHAQPVQVMGGTTAVTGTLTVNQGTMAALPAGANLMGDVSMQVRTASAGGTLVHHVVSAATTNALNIKASAGRLYGWDLSNTTAVWQFVKLHNTAGAPTAGAGVVQTIGIPPNGKAENYVTHGEGFTTGIGRTIVTGAADADATATTAAAVVGDIFFA